MPTIEDAIELALRAHRGQRDKADAPYVLHPLRLLAHMTSETEQMTAVLHDVVEDSDVSLDDLRAAGYPEEVVTAVDALTRRTDESYEAFIARVKPNALARRIKLADLEDNMDVRRIAEPTEKDLARLRRYRLAWSALLSPI